MRGWKYIFAGSIASLAVFFILGIITQASSKEPQKNDTPPLAQNLSAAAIQERNAGAINNLKQQTQTDADYKIDGRTNTFTYISAQDGSLPLQNKPATKDATIIAGQFMNEYGRYFGLRSAGDLHLLQNNQDSLDMQHVRYNQTYHGIPVFGAQTIVHVKKDSSVASANGRTIPNITINTTPLIFLTISQRTPCSDFPALAGFLSPVDLP
jgi:Zn-dependent metalloprotease